MKPIFSIVALFALSITLYGCSSQTYKRLELDDVGSIVSDTFSEMTNCLENSDAKSCTKATALLEEHPWQITGNFEGFWIENSSGLEQDEWDAEVMTVQSNLRKIRTMHSRFVFEAPFYINQ